MNGMDRDDIDRAIDVLCELYPKAFFKNARQRRPLKHTIIKDIKADVADDPESELRYCDIDQIVDWYQSTNVSASLQRRWHYPGRPRRCQGWHRYGGRSP
jgi:hypothetical protein